jgi:hypothetical protein
MHILWLALISLLSAIFILLIVYAASRLAGAGWYKSKLQFTRKDSER